MIPETIPPPHSGRAPVLRHDHLKNAATELEVTFLSEMLKSAGLGEARSAFGGGPGEGQFASLLREEQARQLVGAGRVGLSEIIFTLLKDQENG